MTKQESEGVSKGHLRGSVLLFAGRLVGVLVNFATQILTVRYLSKSDFGVYGLALSVVTAAALLTSFGMPRAASRFLPLYLDKGQNRVFLATIWLMIGTMVGLGLVVVSAVWLSWKFHWGLLPEDPVTRTVIGIMIFLTVCNALDALLVSIFAVLADPWTIFYRRHLAGPALRLLAAAFVIFTGGNVFVFATAQCIAGIVGLLISGLLLFRLLQKNVGNEPPDHDQMEAGKIYSYSGVLLLSDIGFLLRGSLIPIFISWYHAREEIASYQAVLPVARLNELVLVTFSVMFVPGISKLYARKDFGEMNDFYRTFNVWVALLTFPLFVISFAGAGLLSPLLFGEEYSDASIILAVLSLGFFINAALGSSQRVLRVVGSFRVLLGIDVAIALVSVLLNYCLIPSLGALGAAIAVSGAYAVQSVFFQWGVYQATGMRSFSFVILSPCIYSVLVAGVAASVIAWGPASYLLSGVVVFGAVIVLLLILLPRANLVHHFPEIKRFPLVGRWLAIRNQQGDSND